jgi:hypothetical protein
MKLYLFIIIAISIFAACDTANESKDKTKEIDKSNALETAIAVTHLDSTRDIITTTYKTWVNNNNTREIQHSDTIASLGFGEVQGTDEQGNEVEKIAQKDYEIFITVK